MEVQKSPIIAYFREYYGYSLLSQTEKKTLLITATLFQQTNKQKKKEWTDEESIFGNGKNCVISKQKCLFFFKLSKVNLSLVDAMGMEGPLRNYNHDENFIVNKKKQGYH